jgi:hypothetical protein
MAQTGVNSLILKGLTLCGEIVKKADGLQPLTATLHLLHHTPMVAQLENSSSTRPHHSREVLQVIQMQSEAYEYATDVTLTLKERREWAKIYDLMAERRRILKGKPLPGSLSHEKVKIGAQMKQISALSALASVEDDASVDESEANSGKDGANAS